MSPPSGNIAPPGYYMLFLLDSAGVPSVAQFIQLTPYTTTPPTGAITSPATDPTVTEGNSVNFSTSTAAASYSWVFPGGTPSSSVAQNPGIVTFSTEGTYVASLTVADASGNSDASPPTRTITVLPTIADFGISVSPSFVTVTPGQSANFTVTVSRLSGHPQTVSLSLGSQSGFPSGVTGAGFSPFTIRGAGTSTLTVDTTTSVVPGALSLTITGSDGIRTHTASTILLVDLAPPASLTATPGNTQVSLSWPASAGASSYQVLRALVSGGPYLPIACPNGTSYTDTNLMVGPTYYYTVSAFYTDAVDQGAASANSPEASAKPGFACGLLGVEACLVLAAAWVLRDRRGRSLRYYGRARQSLGRDLSSKDD
jgi:hypothetical protein